MLLCLFILKRDSEGLVETGFHHGIGRVGIWWDDKIRSGKNEMIETG